MLTAKWFLRSIISFLVLQGVLGDDEGEIPECDHLRITDPSTGASSGYVRSRYYREEGYTIGSRCQYTIQIPQGYRLKLHFDALDIEPSDNCSLDSLQINDTLTVKTLCGTNTPEPYFVKEGVKYVHFTFRSNKNPMRPDHTPRRRGFSVHYWTLLNLDDEAEFPECDHLRITDPSTGATSGHFTSPHYREGGYPIGSRCQFTINIPQGYRLKLQFDALDIEPSDSCSLDSLQINDTLTVKTLCGTNTPEPYFVKDGVKYVHFSFRSNKNPMRPDHTPKRRGFSVHYWTLLNLG